MQLPILSGVVANESAEFRTSYPVNLEPVLTDSKISRGQFRMTAGATSVIAGPGADRGGYEWNNDLYRAMGSKLVRLDFFGNLTELGDIGDDGRAASFQEGFDRLAIRSAGKLYYWDGASLVQVTDPDLGTVADMIWIDGYYMTTDGTYVLVTELSNPLAVDPAKYGSAEDDPDMVTGLLKVRGEAVVMGRYTTQIFRDVGGNGFPFQTVRGATIPYGCVGADAKCLFADTFAFVGGGRGEGLGVFIGGPGTAERISPPEIEDILQGVADPTQIELENRTYRGEQRLFVHLTDRTLVFCLNASQAAGQPVWFIAHSGRGDPYRPRHAVHAYGKTYVGDAFGNEIGILTDDVTEHFGDRTEWEFNVGLIYNEAKGGVLHSVELVGLPGRAPEGENPQAFLSMTRDGRIWSAERPISMGQRGQKGVRMQWRPKAAFRSWMGLRFRGYNSAFPGFAACEVNVTPRSA